MEIVEVTWGRALKVWWTFMWKGMAFALLASIGVGLVFGFIGAILGLPQGAVMLFNALVGLLVGCFVGVWVIKGILYKRYSDFSVVLIANNDSAAPKD